MTIDLTKYVESEILKDESSTVSWQAGCFEYELILNNPPFMLIHDMSTWARNYCADDYNIIKDTSLVVTSGMYRFLPKPHVEDLIVKYRFRMYIPDSVLFRLTWF